MSEKSLVCENINRALKEDDAKLWKGNEIARSLCTFDVEGIKNEIEKESSLCKASVGHGTHQGKMYVYVKTSYEHAKTVMAQLLRIALENDLVLYDAEKDRTFATEIFDDAFAKTKMRMQQLHNILLKEVNNLWRIRLLGFFDGNPEKKADYCVTLKKIKGVSLEKRIVDFYELLKKSLISGEELVLENKCFAIKSKSYKITFTLEAYKKNAESIGYISDGQPYVDKIRRMSCEKAYNWLKETAWMDKSYGRYMYLTEMVQGYPNPADRYVEGVNISKEEEKTSFYFGYNKYIGGAVGIRPVVNIWDIKKEEISTLVIDDVDAGPILDVIAEYYPYIDKRYYGPNHIPAEMWVQIMNKIKKIRDLIIEDPLSEELDDYLKKENFHYLERGCEVEDEIMFFKDFREFVCKYKYDAVKIYDVFLKWSQAQLDAYDYDDGLMFNVEGP